MHFRVEPNEPLPFLKKNGTIHSQKCALHYGASQAATAREWYRCGAPILQPAVMVQWLRDRDDNRLAKIAAANRRYVDKEKELVRMYTDERMGLRAISRYFNRRPSIPGVRKILIQWAVYRSEERLDQQQARSQERRQAVIAREKLTRHRLAVCLSNLRRGVGVETTCKTEGWNIKSIWNDLGRRKSYRMFVRRRNRRWPDKRAVGKQYSRKYLTESAFQDVVEGVLAHSGLEYVRECRLFGCRTRVDFRLADNSFLECKVAVNSGQTYEFIGQAVHYKEFADRIVLCIPSDVQMRSDLHALIAKLGVVVCTEFTLAQCLSSDATPLLPIPVSPPRKSSFVCKCCGSEERRRHRMNSYCLDCASLIPTMKFDQRLDRWVTY